MLEAIGNLKALVWMSNDDDDNDDDELNDKITGRHYCDLESIAAEEILADADLKSIAGNHLKSITHFHLLGGCYSC